MGLDHVQHFRISLHLSIRLINQFTENGIVCKLHPKLLLWDQVHHIGQDIYYQVEGMFHNITNLTPDIPIGMITQYDVVPVSGVHHLLSLKKIKR